MTDYFLHLVINEPDYKLIASYELTDLMTHAEYNLICKSIMSCNNFKRVN